MDTRNYRDRAEYMKKRVAQKRRDTKLKAVEYKGGKCEICGYDRCVWALDFHHINPEDKYFAIGSRGYARSWESVRKELDKCILVCANCHREIEAGFILAGNITAMTSTVNREDEGSNPSLSAN